MIESIFCFRISDKAGLAHDERGNNAPCYVQTKLPEIGLIEKDQYERLHEAVKHMTSNQLNLPIEYIEKITQEEYDVAHEEELE